MASLVDALWAAYVDSDFSYDVAFSLSSRALLVALAVGVILLFQKRWAGKQTLIVDFAVARPHDR
jgi:hypothetical protein